MGNILIIFGWKCRTKHPAGPAMVVFILEYGIKYYIHREHYKEILQRDIGIYTATIILFYHLFITDICI